MTVEENVDPNYSPQGGLFEWTDERYVHIIVLRQKALDHARKTWADYLFVSHIAHALLKSQFKCVRCIQLTVSLFIQSLLMLTTSS